MSTIISSDRITDEDGNPQPAPTISNGAFWPAVSVDAFMAAQRLSGSVNNQLAANALQQAVIKTNRELREWRLVQEANSITKLADVAHEVEGAPADIYLQAVHSLAKAGLVKHYRDYDSTKDGHQRVDALGDSVDDLMQDYREAISALQSQLRATVELI